jgi:serine protease Do
MKRYFLLMAASLLIGGLSATAQDVNPDNPDKPGKEKRNKELRDKDKIREYDEIVIKRKDAEANKKVTIEIKDDEVLVDGKPIDEYKDEDLSVQKRSMNRFRLHAPASPFRHEGGDWLLENGDAMGVERAFLGVMTEGTSNGARVEEVTRNSAAEKAGLKTGDVITRINDKEVFDHEALSGAISELEPGDKVSITYKRDGKENKTTATLGKRMMPEVGHIFPHGGPGVVPPMAFNFDNENFEHNFENAFEFRNRGRLGIKAQDTEDGNGVKVIEVEEGSAAEKAGIKEDDIITSFEGQKVSSASGLARASREAREKSSLKVEVKRNGKPQTIEVKIPKKLKTANL